MTIKVGDKMPKGQFTRMGANGPEPVPTDDLFRGKKVVLFSVPGAFTPTCSAKHLPGFINNYDALKKKGVDTIACMAVNDVFVMKAWGESSKATGKVEMLADGNGEFAAAMGLEFDLTGRGLGVRSRRFAAVIEDGIVTHIAVEEGRGVDVSSANAILAKL